MNNEPNLLDKATHYADRYSLGVSAEELFVEFEWICRVHADFDAFLRDNGGSKKLEKMQRSERLKERRKLFSQWYFQKYPRKMTKARLIELSEMTFLSERTVQSDVFEKVTETTAQTSDKN